jgi:hypothetical protein
VPESSFIDLPAARRYAAAVRQRLPETGEAWCGTIVERCAADP